MYVPGTVLSTLWYQLIFKTEKRSCHLAAKGAETWVRETWRGWPLKEKISLLWAAGWAAFLTWVLFTHCEREFKARALHFCMGGPWRSPLPAVRNGARGQSAGLPRPADWTPLLTGGAPGVPSWGPFPPLPLPFVEEARGELNSPRLEWVSCCVAGLHPPTTKQGPSLGSPACGEICSHRNVGSRPPPPWGASQNPWPLAGWRCVDLPAMWPLRTVGAWGWGRCPLSCVFQP